MRSEIHSFDSKYYGTKVVSQAISRDMYCPFLQGMLQHEAARGDSSAHQTLL
jgi:hypothetical protein